MANNKVRHYRTKEAGKVPLASKLLEGEIAINLADTKIYTNVDGKIVTIGHGADATIDGNNTWTGTVKANKVVSDSAPTKNAELTRKDYVDAGDKTNADAIKANSDLIKTNADNIKVNADAIKTVDIKADTKVKKSGDTMTGALTVPSSITIVGPGNRHVWFEDSAGVEKGLIYSDGNTDNLNIRVNRNRFFSFGADGNFTFPSSVVGPNAVLRGSVYFDDKPQGTYEITNLSTAATNNGTNLLRRFRSQRNSAIFHEVVQGSEVRYSHGDNADASPIWKYHTQGIDIVNKLEVQNWTIGPSNMLILKDGQSVNGEPNGLVRGAVQGGPWVNWRARASGLQVNIAREDSAYNIWKATLWGKNHVAAMQVIHNSDINNAMARIQVHNTEFNFGARGGFDTPAKGYFGGDLACGGNLRSANEIYWGSKGAWAASDGNIYGTRWGALTGHSGQLAWLGDALDAVNAKASNTSDIRLKKNLEKIESATDKIQKLTGYTYDKATFIGSEESYRDAGVIAQEVQAVLPEAVNIIDLNDTPTLAVSPSAMIALLVESTKEQAEKLEKQNQLIKELMKRISKLEK